MQRLPNVVLLNLVFTDHTPISNEEQGKGYIVKQPGNTRTSLSRCRSSAGKLDFQRHGATSN
eukprot:5114118-Amphidinium_carterae.1